MYMFMSCGIVGNVDGPFTPLQHLCLVLFPVIYIHPWATPQASARREGIWIAGGSANRQWLRQAGAIDKRYFYAKVGQEGQHYSRCCASKGIVKNGSRWCSLWRTRCLMWGPLQQGRCEARPTRLTWTFSIAENIHDVMRGILGFIGGSHLELSWDQPVVDKEI